MDKPTIIINGKEIEMQTPKARLWREIVKFNDERRDLPVEDFCNEHAKIIAAAFGVTADEVLDNLYVDDIMPTYFKVFSFVLGMLTAKLSIDKKNILEGVTAQT